LAAPVPTEPLPAAVDTVLGWVMREATTNVLRHSQARSVTVRTVRNDDTVELTVTDDGSGVSGGSGSGLAGLAERLAALGGRLDAGPAAGGGFTVTARVPLAVPAPVAPAGAR
jgi:two-component system sensor histidine kinase DesK